MGGRVFSGAVCVALGVLGSVALGAEPLRIAATGDSLTNGYSPYRLGLRLAAVNVVATVTQVATGGCDSARYTGLTVDPWTGTCRDYAAEVLAGDPDVILFMLGANDVSRVLTTPTAFGAYQQNVAGVLDRYQSAVNGRGRAPTVVWSTLLPMVSADPLSSLSLCNQLIDDTFNPWIRQEAARRGLVLLDVNALIRQQDDWQALYSDGIHLWAQGAAGYLWLAEQFRAAAMPAGDLNWDRRVDLSDLTILANSYGATSGKTWADGDLTADGAVTIADLTVLANVYGRADNPPAVTVPGPAPLALLAVGAVALACPPRAPGSRQRVRHPG